MTPNYLNFDLRIAPSSANGDYVSRVIDSPAGEAENRFSWPFSDLDLEIFVLRMTRRSSGVRRVGKSQVGHARIFGQTLYEAVFGGAVATCLMRSLDESERQGKGLRLRLRLTDTPDLLHVPWEFLYLPPRKRFLVVSSETPLVRYIELPKSIRPTTVTGPLRILIVTANPAGPGHLDAEKEQLQIRQALRSLTDSGSIAITEMSGATLQELQDRLRRDDYHIIHFIGHGGFSESTGEGVLYFQDSLGGQREVSSESLGTIIHDHRSLRLVVLNSCEGARSSSLDPLSGTASSLVAQGLPAVVAMQFEISDLAAIEFAHEFYQALCDDYPIDAAMCEARKRLYASEHDLEWGTPVLHMRAPDGRIFNIETPTTRPRTPPSELPRPLWHRRRILQGALALSGATTVGLASLKVFSRGEAQWRVRWEFQTAAEVFSSPLVSNGLVVVGGVDNHVYALDEATGEVRWRYPTDGAVTSSPTESDGLIYIGSNDQRLHAIDARTGLGRWIFDTGGALHSSPAVAHGIVFVGSRDDRLYAVDAASGEQIWTFAAGDWFNSSPTVRGGVVYVGSRDHHVYAIEALSGEEHWRYLTGSTIDSTPTVEGDTLWIGCDDRNVYAINRTGVLSWKVLTGGGVVSTPLFFDHVVFAGSDDGNLYALDASTGRERWRFQTNGGIRSSPTTDGRLVYVGSRDHRLYALDLASGQEVASHATQAPIDDSSPSVTKTGVYVGSLDGKIYALEAPPTT